MSGLNPRLRQRVETVTVRAAIKTGTSNAELFEAWRKAVKLAPSTLQGYACHVGEALRYFTTDEGQEIPVRKWSKEDVWAWVHFQESNYCRNFQQIHIRSPPVAKCRAKVWVGSMPATDAAAKCHGCPAFAPLSGNTVRTKLHALDKWFRYLARVGAVAVNFVPDVVKEWYAENPDNDNGGHEKKRNPTHEEVRRMVNETAHPMRRALYAVSFKWWLRPNETLLLDRYASLGLPMPAGHAVPPGFRGGFPAHPEVPSFAEGGGLVYLPAKLDANGAPQPDKRSGNRWFVVDAELRPILEQYLAWWERTVKRRPDGTPATTALWLTNRGTPWRPRETGSAPANFNERTWYVDALRLGIMQPGDRENPDRRLTGHCARHYGQKKCQEDKVHPDWNKHFRGDAFDDARGHYFKPGPLDTQREYLAQVRPIGFKPIPDAPKFRKAQSAGETHRALLLAEAAHLRTLTRHYTEVRCVRVFAEGEEAWTVPARLAPSFAFALRAARPGVAVRVEPDATPTRKLQPLELAGLCEKAALMLG